MQREIAWAYPTAFDQVQYLRESHTVYENIQRVGLLGGLAQGLASPTPQGMLMHVEAALLFLLLGPSRLSALTVNFLHFAAFQAALVAVVLWASRRWTVALTSLGLLLTSSTFFFYAGGIADFRLDCGFWSLFGIFTCAVVRSRVFLSRRWSIIAGLVAAFTALFRFISIVYFVGILGASMLACAALWRQRVPGARERFRGALTAAAVFLAAAVPAAALKWPSIHGYYVVGHLTGAEKDFRAIEQGVITRWDSLTFYPRSALVDHAGVGFGEIALLVLAVATVLRLRSRQGRNSFPFGAGMAFAAACALIPLTVLTMNTAKSPVVGHILVIPLLWMTVLPLVMAARNVGREAWPRRLLATVGTIALLTGMWTLSDRFSRRGLLRDRQPEILQALALHEAIINVSQALGWSKASISTDHLSEAVNAVAVSAYERHGFYFNPTTRLSRSIFAIDEEAALVQLRRSHFAVVTTGGGAVARYPFDASMEAVRPALKRFCDENLVLLGRFQLEGREVALYVRPTVSLQGDSGGWITDRGFTVIVPARILQARPSIVLAGTTHFAWLGGVPGVRAVAMTSSLFDAPVPARLTAWGDEYCLVIMAPPVTASPAEVVRIDVTFDDFFVPKQVGINQDTRRLVIATPRRVGLLREGAPACSGPRAVRE